MEQNQTINKPLHIWTPVFESIPITKIAGCKTFLKMECFQPTSAFKIRGIGKLCQDLASKGTSNFVSSSGGNAGYAAAYAGRKLGIKVTVFVPKTTKEHYIDIIKQEGAEVFIVGDVWDQANEAALEFVSSNKGSGFIPPFDHPLIWQGHSTMVDEIVASNIEFDAIMLSVGGGGLACGILEGLHRHNLQNIPIVAVETKGAASFRASLDANKVVKLPSINTIATSLGAEKISDNLFAWTKKHTIESIVVSDHDTAKACKQFADQHRVLVEPACGAALAPLYLKDNNLNKYKSVLVIVCGGIGITTDLLNEYLLS